MRCKSNQDILHIHITFQNTLFINNRHMLDEIAFCANSDSQYEKIRITIWVFIFQKIDNFEAVFIEHKPLISEE